MRRGIRILWLAGIFAVAFQSAGRSIESKYLYQEPPLRLAMVIGNSNYQNLDELPGSSKDVNRITELLTSLGFSVTPVKDVKTSADFQTLYLLPFLDKVRDGALVIFYFSGHGFTYDNESYLVPTLFPKQLTTPVYLAAIPATTVLNTISARNAGLSIMILDSCREIFDIKDYVRAEDKQYVKKGFPETSTAANQIMSYAAHPGMTASGSATIELSPYTESLAKFIGVLDSEWSDVKKEVTIDVRHTTSDSQSPWFSESNTAYVWFNASPKVMKLIQEEWESALKRGTVSAIERFADLYAVTPYGAAARKWLIENKNREIGHFTQVSPLAVDALWSSTTATMANQLTGPLAFDRSAATADVSADQSTAILESASTADILREAGQVVLLVKTPARSRPSQSAEVVKNYAFGTKLRVLDSDSAGNWLKVFDENRKSELFLEIPATVQSRPLSLGEPIREVRLGARSMDVPGLVDAVTLQNQLAEIRNAGWTVTWVSIATPRAQSGKRVKILDAMSNNALLLLTNAGIPRGKITTARGLDFAGDDVRLRFFGKQTPREHSDAR